MNHGSATLSLDAGLAGRGRKRAFARHFGEMLIAMFLGMGVLGGLAAPGFAVAGGSSSDLPGGVRVMLMGIYMTVPMVLWMRYRGRAAARNAEMALSSSPAMPATARQNVRASSTASSSPCASVSAV